MEKEAHMNNERSRNSKIVSLGYLTTIWANNDIQKKHTFLNHGVDMDPERKPDKHKYENNLFLFCKTFEFSLTSTCLHYVQNVSCL